MHIIIMISWRPASLLLRESIIAVTMRNNNIIESAIDSIQIEHSQRLQHNNMFSNSGLNNIIVMIIKSSTRGGLN